MVVSLLRDTESSQEGKNSQFPEFLYISSRCCAEGLEMDNVYFKS